MNISRYIHTVRFLKLSQLFYLVKYRFLKTNPKITFSQTKEVQRFVWEAPKTRICNWKGKSFYFLDISKDIEDRTDWSLNDVPKLWLYNLHYLDDLDGANASLSQEELIIQWIKANPLKNKGVAWDPYVISLRVVNLLKWMMRFKVESKEIEESVKEQLSVLMSRLEYHLLGNHLFTNAKALVFGGAFLGEPYLTKGIELLTKQLDEQILSDGAHFERSPMYQGIILRDLLDLLYLSILLPETKIANLQDTLRKKVVKVFCWFRAFHHPDGQISFFNDSTFDVCPKIDFFEKYLNFLDIGVKNEEQGLKVFYPSNFFTFKSKDFYVAGDIGKPEPDYQPGHAHAETNCFELSFQNKRWVVNKGVSTYEVGKQRLLERSTRSHSTVEISGKNSSDVWSSFRVAKRAKEVELFRSDLYLACRHDGFYRQGLATWHSRQWDFSNLNEVIIKDSLVGKIKKGKAYFHLHPDVTVKDVEKNSLITSQQEHTLLWRFQSQEIDINIESGRWSYGFGKAKRQEVIVVSFFDNLETLIEMRQ